MTEELFRHDGYLNSCKAQITAIDETGIRLDKTVFYPLGGGQPGDIGTLVLAGGAHVPIVDTQKIPGRHRNSTHSRCANGRREGRCGRHRDY